MTRNEPGSPQTLLDIAFGYHRSNTLFSIIELKIPTLLADKSSTVEVLAEQVKIHPLALDRLLNAGVALGLFERSNDNAFQNTALSAAYLIENRENYLGEQFEYYKENSYPKLSELTCKLREWKPGANDEQSSAEEDQSADSLPPQHNLALIVGKALGRAYDFSRHQKLLDVGGATGAMSLGICSLHKELRATVLELPKVLEETQNFVTESAFADRIETRGGNFKEDSLPEGFDCILLANLLSVASEETNRKFFRQIYERLPAGGVCIISGWILDDSRTSPEIAVLFCLEDVIWQVPDVERDESTYRAWLAEAGFTNIKRELYLPPYSYIAAVKE